MVFRVVASSPRGLDPPFNLKLCLVRIHKKADGLCRLSVVIDSLRFVGLNQPSPRSQFLTYPVNLVILSNNVPLF